MNAAGVAEPREKCGLSRLSSSTQAAVSALGMGKAHEQGVVKQFFAHASVEAFDVTNLHWLAWSDAMSSRGTPVTSAAAGGFVMALTEEVIGLPPLKVPMNIAVPEAGSARRDGVHAYRSGL